MFKRLAAALLISTALTSCTSLSWVQRNMVYIAIDHAVDHAKEQKSEQKVNE